MSFTSENELLNTENGWRWHNHDTPSNTEYMCIFRGRWITSVETIAEAKAWIAEHQQDYFDSHLETTDEDDYEIKASNY